VRESIQEWESRGSLTMSRRLNAQASEILQHHQPVPLRAEIREKLDRILKQQENI